MKKKELEKVLREMKDVSLLEEIRGNCINCLLGENALIKVFKKDTKLRLLIENLEKRSRSNSGSNFLGFEESLIRLKQFKGHSIRIVKVACDSSTYTIYFTLGFQKILGLTQNSNLNSEFHIDIQNYYQKKGFSDYSSWKPTQN